MELGAIEIDEKTEIDVSAQRYGTWDVDYSRTELTDWEQLPAGDLRDVVSRLGTDLRTIRTAAEIGCGRGLRSLVMLSTLDVLNRPDFAMWGIDQSHVAISAAKSLRNNLRENRAPEPPFDVALAPYLSAEAFGLLPIEYEHADLFSWFSEHPGRFDLVIDWMCFHEVSLERRVEYANIIAHSCAKYYIVNTFSREGSTVEDLGLVAGVQKFQIGEEEVVDLFGPWFDVIDYCQFGENLDPHPRPSDGIVAAKRAYIMKRRP